MTENARNDKQNLNSQERDRFKGIIITDGTDFTIHNLRIVNDGSEVHASHAGTSLRLDTCRHWLKIAVAHVDDAATANRDLLEVASSEKDTSLGLILQDEFRASMQATVASAIAVDAFYSSVKDKIVVPNDQSTAWKENRTARWKQMAEVFRLAFGLQKDAVFEVRKLLKELSKYRDWAIHPPANNQSPVLRSDVQVGVEWRLVAFRYQNAATCVQMALALVNKMLEKVCPESEALANYCEGLRPTIDEMIEGWMKEYPSWPVMKSPESSKPERS